MHIQINKKFLTYNKYKVKCALGKRGIGTKKKEGDKITPKGRYNIKFLLYRKDRIKKIKTKLKKIIIKKNLGWCDDPSSKNYNKLIYLPTENSHEKLYKSDNSYDIVLVLNYNMSPVKNGKGSAIFIHVAKRNYKKTLGCIAINKIALLKIISEIKKNTIVEILDQK
ncbi:L,D-transpeptidase family protein [Candidatus Pelagibacter bacterium]|nr:L,D-transpeptidase family protein [Candidatus Pelagibacter bacterium]